VGLGLHFAYLEGQSAGNDDEMDRMHTSGTSTETGAPEVAATGDKKGLRQQKGSQYNRD